MTASGGHAPRSFDDVLGSIRREAKSTRDLGDRFERITKDFLREDRHYANRFRNVWLWKEWPKNDGADTGIDLVAEEHDGSLCAIQCKCYADNNTLDMKAVSTFLAKAGSLKIPSTILVYTGDDPTQHAQKILRDSGTQIITPEHFRQSGIYWGAFPKIHRKAPKTLRPHQTAAFEDVIGGLQNHDRGKLIMACGTGKTLTALHVAEKQVGLGGSVLYLVPSISLILQSMREWSENSNMRHNYMAVCSDKSTGEDASITELESRVSTKDDKLQEYIEEIQPDAMNVIFSTYHSIGVVERVMKGRQFDLVLCDEAHRTTGTEGKSYYTRVHDDDNLRAKKRLYMTATPRVYSAAIKSHGDRKGKVVYSMDDEKRYGPELHKLSFYDAVHKHRILADFKVKIAIVDADVVDKEFQQAVADRDGSMPLDERTLMAAVWHGLCYPDDDESTPRLLQRVIAFCNLIDRSEMFAGIMKDPNDNDRSFEGVVGEIEKKRRRGYGVEVRHIDGKHRAMRRRDDMRWLDESGIDRNACRIVSNARCLSEGVDVPALDGVVFLNPRKSVVDVVQSVGRVMRKVPGKDFGYVILPVAIPAGLDYREAMDDNKTFKVVWEVLNALRSHDQEFAREINKLILDRNTENTGKITPRISASVMGREDPEAEPITELFDRIKSKIITNVGDADYYDLYGEELGSAASTIEARIRNMRGDPKVAAELSRLRDGLRSLINDSVDEDAVIRTLAQHMVLSRVFDALFQGEFASHNPVSEILGRAARRIGLGEELEGLEGFYAKAEAELSRVDTREGRQTFIKKVYGNFFKAAARKETEQHGVVYTPVEVVDFILASVRDVLGKEFKTSFEDRSVKVLDPFAGTGTFLSRLIESGMLGENIYEKYRHDLFANELILLAYYVATVNIETTYSSMRRGGRYVPFEGISYTDTLVSNPQYREDSRHRREATRIGEEFRAAHARVRQQRGSHLHVIVGNPPYSKGQSNYNDDNANVPYPEVDGRIRETYLDEIRRINPKAGAKNSLYDSYVRSIRWASDRIGNAGVIGFVTNASFIRTESSAGIRARLQREFTDVWILDLRGNARTQGEVRKKEGGNVFGLGSRAPVAITILAKNPKKRGCTIRYRDIGDGLTREQKLEMIKEFASINGVPEWEEKEPDRHHDWLGKRSGRFQEYLPMGSKEAKMRKSNAVFVYYSQGVLTSRDIWAYNSSSEKLKENMRTTIVYCNSQNWNRPKINPHKAKWDGSLSKKLQRHGRQKFQSNKIRLALYRPFFNQYVYFDRVFLNAINRVSEMFPNSDSENLVIHLPYKFVGSFYTFITNLIPDVEITHHGQCFPLYVYRDGKRHDNITNQTLSEYRTHYKNPKITKDDIFYYVYGLLHHEGYRATYANNLSRELPHIPMAPDFWAFSKIGRKLADLHLSWETCKRHDLGKPKSMFGKYEKMDFAQKTVGKKRVRDRSVLRINGAVAFDNIPDIKYRVNGRTPLEWAIDRYRRTVDKESGIVNDATGIDPIPLIERLVHVGVESDVLISQLPQAFEPKNWRPRKTGIDAHLQE